MSCDASREQIPALFSEALGNEERDEIERHLRGCGPCRAELEEYRRLVRVLEGAPEADATLLRRTPRLRRRPLLPAALAAGLVLLVIGSILLRPSASPI